MMLCVDIRMILLSLVEPTSEQRDPCIHYTCVGVLCTAACHFMSATGDARACSRLFRQLLISISASLTGALYQRTSCVCFYLVMRSVSFTCAGCVGTIKAQLMITCTAV